MNFDIVEIEEFSGRMAKIYSIMLDGDEMTLLDHFFDENEQFEEDLSIIAAKLKIMGQDKGCWIQFFKENEGAPGDGVVALWNNRLRLYCLRFDNTCIFVGSGGYKPPDIAAYQDDYLLNYKAQQMKAIAACINNAIKEKDMIILNDGSFITSDFINLEI
ncbi:hypothetical protein SDC9_59342 [bioreactor metagenome]|uniref:Uncharacterized protein n=1 Tax=bioreactor metagenome TaxID=1076179 RepID=A0A644XAM5_9ZZZZ|nr:hypothetical protein [Rikenellaceae bacterium]